MFCSIIDDILGFQSDSNWNSKIL